MNYYAFEGLTPAVHPAAFVRPSAILIGGVTVGVDVYTDPLASLHGSYGQLIVQTGANVQEGCIMHGYCDADTIVRKNDHTGHGATLHGCVIGRDALVGMNSVIMDGAVIGKESIAVAMSFIEVGSHGEKRQLLMGTPARTARSVGDGKLRRKWLNIKEYQDPVRHCRVPLHGTQPLRQMEESRPRLQGTTDVTPKR